MGGCADPVQRPTYDEIGNPLSYRDGMSFTWQNGRQLSRAQNSEELISYSYNADGIRTRKLRSNGETTDYYLNGSNIITQITNSILNPDHSVRLDFYYDENSSLLGFAYNGQDYWYVRNGQGDVIGILDKDGTEVVSYTYNSWGAPGLYYLNSRYYDPVVGRFVNVDGFVSAGSGMLSSNMFLYCENNPIHRTDPSGKHFLDVPLSTAALQSMSQSDRDAYYYEKKIHDKLYHFAPTKPDNVINVVDFAGTVAGATHQIVKDQTQLTHYKSSTGTYYFTRTAKYGNTTKVANSVGKVATVVAVGSTAWDMVDIVSNDQLTTGQKVLGCGIEIGGFGLGIGAGMATAWLTTAAINAWNPTGWGLLLIGVGAIGLSALSNKFISDVKYEAYKTIGMV